ncbi:hypothetical protein GCM10009533_49450 [Saccharopolyspora spinosporotrichia]|uniref:Uncharacterized protein n=1 Tax=Saccharopolyspora erythraea TaxID=1836 RepID=A0ABP3NHT2_SACER
MRSLLEGPARLLDRLARRGGAGRHGLAGRERLRGRCLRRHRLWRARLLRLGCGPRLGHGLGLCGGLRLLLRGGLRLGGLRVRRPLPAVPPAHVSRICLVRVPAGRWRSAHGGQAKRSVPPVYVDSTASPLIRRAEFARLS